MIRLLCLLLCAWPAAAYTVDGSHQTVATDGTASDTQAACTYVKGLAQDGWTVLVGTPGSTYVWTSEVVWGPTNTATIAGAGGATNSITIQGNGISYVLWIGGYAPKLTTVSNINFSATGSGVSSAMMGVSGEGVCFRITGCSFLAAGSGSFVVQVGELEGSGSLDVNLGPYGLIDHCNFYLPGGQNYNCINVSCNGSKYQAGWKSAMSWGTTNTVTVEDCRFSQPTMAITAVAAVESDDCARWCFRNNWCTNMWLSWHGTNSGGKSSTLQVEVYNNLFNAADASHTAAYVMLARGGTAVIFSNTVIEASSGCIGSLAQFWVECAATTWASEFCPQQLLYPGDYPANQQIGLGSATNGAGQSAWPVYIWSNTVPTAAGAIYLGSDSGDRPFIQQGRDIFTNQPMPSYTALVYPSPLVNGGGSPIPPAPGNGTVTGLIVR